MESVDFWALDSWVGLWTVDWRLVLGWAGAEHENKGTFSNSIVNLYREQVHE